MNKIVMIVLLFVVVVAGSYFLVLNNTSSLSNGKTITTPSMSTTVTPKPTIDNSDLKRGGSSYRDDQGMYSFLYPSEYVMDKQNDGKQIRIYKKGKTQKGQTEIYDGVIIVFETIALEGQTLSGWVDNTVESSTTDGTSEIVEPKTSITDNTYPGFTYAIRSLGISKDYVFQKNAISDYAVHISTSVSDPQHVGYQTEVDKTLSTLELLK